MDDEEWIIEDPSESQPEEPPAEEAPAPAEEPPPEPEPEPEPVVLGTEAKKLVYKHWVRPKFLQYSYMYDYRYNYYNDVINYLDRRNRGLITEPPRAQTWAERALRTYISKSGYGRTCSQDKMLLHHISSGARFHRYHSKSLISRKYSHLGFNCITI